MSLPLRALGLIASLALAAVWFLQPPAESPLPSEPTPLAPSIEPEAVELRDVSFEWLDGVSHQQSSTHLTALTESLGGGVCALDADRDGWMDLFFVGGSGQTQHYGRLAWWNRPGGNRLLRNVEGRHFEDVTEAAGLGARLHGMGCAVADLDNDGFSDLVATGFGANRVYRNEGKLRFADVSADSGIVNDPWSTGASIDDFDGDGLLDVYVSNYVHFERGARTFERSRGFVPGTDGAFDATLYDAQPNHLYRNLGGFRFRDVAVELGVADARGRSLGSAWIDVNQDRWPDLLILNDHGSPNQLFVNEKGRGFSQAGERYAPFEVAGSHALASADVDGDGSLEFFLSRAAGHPPVLLRGPGPRREYADLAWTSGLARAELLPFGGWGAVFADFNGDGSADLFVANGSTLPDSDSPYVPQAQANSLFLNDGRGRFVHQVAEASLSAPHASRGAIAADLDNDGRPELIVANNNDPLQIFEIHGRQGNWLRLDLGRSHRDAQIYGSTLTLETEARSIRRTLRAPHSFLSQGDPRIQIGLGSDREVRRLRIDWHDGRSSVFEDPPINSELSLDPTARSLVKRDGAKPATGHLASVATNLDDAALRKLASVVATEPSDAVRASKLMEIWTRAPAQARAWLLADLATQGRALELPIVLRALEDDDPQVRAAAIEVLRRQELELGVAWLIPRLADEDSQVQCAAAAAFQFFFDEEEAVTHRKWLAVTPLLRLLETGTPETRACAADALGAAEQKRAVLPLIRQAESAQAEAVRVAAIRALGRVRDRRALEPVRARVEDRESPSAVVAAGLIALSRLDDPSLDERFDRAVTPEGVRARHAARDYDVLTQLFSMSDGVVFARSRLEAVLRRMVREDERRASPKPPEERSRRIAALRSIGVARLRELQPVVSSAAASSDPELRSEALVALASLDAARAEATLAALIPRAPEAEIAALLERLTAQRHRFTGRTVAALLRRSDTASHAIELLQTLDPGDAAPLADEALRGRLDEDTAVALLELCAQIPFDVTSANGWLGAHAARRVRLGYAQCALTHAVRDVPEAERVSSRALLHSIRSDPSWDSDARAQLLIAAAEHDALVARTFLWKELDSIPEARLSDAVRALASHGDDLASPSALWRILQNPQRPQEARLRAAELLATHDGDRTRRYIYQEFFSG